MRLFPRTKSCMSQLLPQPKLQFWAKIFHYCDFFYIWLYHKNHSKEIFWPKKGISQIYLESFFKIAVMKYAVMKFA